METDDILTPEERKALLENFDSGEETISDAYCDGDFSCTVRAPLRERLLYAGLGFVAGSAVTGTICYLLR